MEIGLSWNVIIRLIVYVLSNYERRLVEEPNPPLLLSRNVSKYESKPLIYQTSESHAFCLYINITKKWSRILR